jgi:hypothetical protein
MKRTVSSFVAMLCLLTLFLSSAACLALPQETLATSPHHHHTANAAEHACCPQRSPAGEHTSSTCCTVHHQPVSAAAAVELQQPDVISHALFPISIQISETVVLSASAKLRTAQPVPLVALRI